MNTTNSNQKNFSNLNPKFKSVVDHLAYLQDKNRVFPKLILGFWGWVGYELITWVTAFGNLETVGVGTGSLVTGIFASGAAYSKFYVETGPNGKYSSLDKKQGG